MERYHYRLKPPFRFVNWLSRASKLGDPSTQPQVQEVDIDLAELNHMNPELEPWLASCGLVCYAARLFRSVPNQSYRLHVDVDPAVRPAALDYVYDDVIKLNFVFHSTSSHMAWYKIKDSVRADPILNANGYGSYNFDAENCQEVYRADANTHCLVHAGRIHTLVNGDNYMQIGSHKQQMLRVCYSLMIRNTANNLTWDSAVELLQDHIE